MRNTIEAKSLFRALAERLAPPRNKEAKGLDEFIELARAKSPKQINITVVEEGVTVDGSPASVGRIDYVKFATVITFLLNEQGPAIARYAEPYLDSRVYSQRLFPNYYKFDKEEVAEMRARAILTATNRRRRFRSELPQTDVCLALHDVDGHWVIDDRLIDLLEKTTLQFHLTPFYI